MSVIRKLSIANTGNQLRFAEHWLEVKRLSPEAAEMLEKVGFKSWAKHAFNPLVLNDSITNNISETWNKVLLPARQRPILSMLEWIRRRLMTRIQSKREKMEKYTGIICPGIVAEIEVLKRGLKRCNVRFNGNDEFEVDEINDLDMYTYVVDLKKYKCDCGIWGLSGIPCLHVLKCITTYNMRVEEYVHPTYFKEKHLLAYSGIIHAIPDESLWDDLQKGKMLPPPWRNPPGRPKGKRRKGPDEQSNPNKMPRSKEAIKCKKCGQSGHNIRTCQNDLVVPPPKSISKGGRPKCDEMGRVCRADETVQGEPKQKRKYTRMPTYKSADVARLSTQNPFDNNLRGIQKRWKSKKKLKELRKSTNANQEQHTYNEARWGPHVQELSDQPTQPRVTFENMLRDPIIGFNFLMDNTYESSSSVLARENVYKPSSTQESINDSQMPRMYSQSSTFYGAVEMRADNDL